MAATEVTGCPKLKVLGNCDGFGKVMGRLLSGSVTGPSVTVTAGVVIDAVPEVVVGILSSVLPKDKVSQHLMLAPE